MSIFKTLTNTVGNVLGGGPAPSIDMSKFNQYYSDVGAVRDLANAPITGLSQAGQAGSNLATQQYQNQLDALRGQNLSNQATGFANLQRYGADAGAQERLARSGNKMGLFANQQLGQANLTNQANITAQDLATQQSQKYNALMQTPNLQLGGINAYNQASIANQSANAARKQGIGNMLGTLGQLGGTFIGAKYGSPETGAKLGGVAGGMAGNLFGGLFG